jgi:hypothetical protein
MSIVKKTWWYYGSIKYEDLTIYIFGMKDSFCETMMN